MSAANILDDLAKMAGGTMSIFSTLRLQIHDEIKARIDEMADRIDLVPRIDLERVEGMLKETRQKQDDLEKRLAILEKSAQNKPANSKK